jgi:hypothetical protein
MFVIFRVTATQERYTRRAIKKMIRDTLPVFLSGLFFFVLAVYQIAYLFLPTQPTAVIFPDLFHLFSMIIGFSAVPAYHVFPTTFLIFLLTTFIIASFILDFECSVITPSAATMEWLMVAYMLGLLAKPLYYLVCRCQIFTRSQDVQDAFDTEKSNLEALRPWYTPHFSAHPSHVLEQHSRLPILLTPLAYCCMVVMAFDYLFNILVFLTHIPSVRILDSPYFILYVGFTLFAIYTDERFLLFLLAKKKKEKAKKNEELGTGKRTILPDIMELHSLLFTVVLWVILFIGELIAIYETILEYKNGVFFVAATDSNDVYWHGRENQTACYTDANNATLTQFTLLGFSMQTKDMAQHLFGLLTLAKVTQHLVKRLALHEEEDEDDDVSAAAAAPQESDRMLART